MSSPRHEPELDLRRRFPHLEPSDWTIPPEDPMLTGAPRRSVRGDVDTVFANARLLASVAGLLTALTLAWWLINGRLPANDPRMGLPMLFLHIGAIYTSARALGSVSQAWKLSLDLHEAERPSARDPVTMALTIGSDIMICLHAAMIVAAILA